MLVAPFKQKNIDMQRKNYGFVFTKLNPHTGGRYVQNVI